MPATPQSDASNVYHWTSTGGCPICDGMSGFHTSVEPKPPHRNCNCQIVLAKRPQGQGTYYYEFRQIGWYRKRGSKFVRWKSGRASKNETTYAEYEYRIECKYGDKSKSGKIKVAQKMADWYRAIEIDKKRKKGTPTKELRKQVAKLEAEVVRRIEKLAQSLNCPAGGVA